MASQSPLQPHHHVVIFPFMAQGHTIPLLDLSKAFSRRGLDVTIITTPKNALTISKYMQKLPNIYVKDIPFPQTDDIPEGCENTTQLLTMSLFVPFLKATLQLKQPFEEILQDMYGSGSLPVCVISDFFLGWTVPICSKFGIPRFVFNGMGVLSTVLSKSIYMNAAQLINGSKSEPIDIPGVKLPFTMTRTDVLNFIPVPDLGDPLSQFILEEIWMFEKESSGIIVNSFMELESEHVSPLESFFVDRCKAWCVGPLHLYDEIEKLSDISQSDPYIKWLDDRDRDKSVIYVSFGTQADVSDLQLDEVAYGLEMSGHSFIWTVRSKTWVPPEGIEKKIKGRGWIASDWVDQRSILVHRATGGFLSHCGWNSVLESVCVGVPLLAWPMMAEQPLNAKFVVEGLEVGLRVPLKRDEIVAVDREVICDVVKEFMESENRKTLRASPMGMCKVLLV